MPVSVTIEILLGIHLDTWILSTICDLDACLVQASSNLQKACVQEARLLCKFKRGPERHNMHISAMSKFDVWQYRSMLLPEVYFQVYQRLGACIACMDSSILHKIIPVAF